MCRDLNHAGNRGKVRCDCDTSAARQARRLRARAHAEYSTGGPASEDVTTIASTAPAHPQVSIERVQALQDEIKQLDANYGTLPYHKNDEGKFIYEVGEREFDNKVDAMLYTNELLEAKTVEAGSVISALADERSGVTLEEIQNYYQTEIAKVEEQLDEGYVRPIPPEQKAKEEAELAAARQAIEDAQVAIDAYEAEHVDDYPHETLSGFASRLQVYRRDNPNDEEANAKYAHLNELGRLHRVSLLNKSVVERDQKAWLNTARDRHSKLKSEYGRSEPVIGEMLKKRAEAYLEVLAEVRQMGGVELKVSADSHKASAKVLQSALRYYPADWIEASNKATSSRELRIKKTTARAHYSDGAYQKSSKRMPSIRSRVEVVGADGQWQPDPGYIHDQGAIAIRPPGGGAGYARYELPNGYSYEAYCEANEVMVVRPDYEVYHSYYGTPETSPGRGWKQVTTVRKNAAGEEMESKDWVRQRTRAYESTRTLKAEITISESHSGFQTDEKGGFTVALHEFAHRVESTSPERISRIESAFLERRRKASEGDEAKAKLTKIYQTRKREVGYEDEFANRYMGKVYAGQRHKELLSTGMEALFGGSYGGLAGTAGLRRDDDMQQLILGLLATS